MVTRVQTCVVSIDAWLSISCRCRIGAPARALCHVLGAEVPVSNLPLLARTLGVSVETLIGEKAAPAKRGPTPKMQQQIERLSRLPQAKQRVVMEMLEGFPFHL